MAYTASLDLRGKRIQDTYQNLVQYDSAAGTAFNGQGSSIDNFRAIYANSASWVETASFALKATSVDSASYAPVEPAYSASVSTAKQNALVTGGTYTITSSWSQKAISASWAPDQTVTVVSASWASASISSSWANEASYSLSTDGLVVESLALNPNQTASYTYPVIPFQSAVTIGESNPHVSGRNCKSGSALFGGGWGGMIYRINNPDVNLQDITSASCITNGRNVSAGIYSAITDAMYYIIGGIYPGTPSTASIVKVDALTLSQSLFYDGIDNGSGGYGFGLPPITADDNYLYVPTAADADCSILKIDITTGALVDSKIWYGAGGSHAAQISDDKTFFIATTGGGSICRVNTSDFSVISSSLSLGFITDDIAILNGYVYPVREAGFMAQFYKVDVNTLSSSIIPAVEHSYGSFTDGYNLYIGNFDVSQIWVYPNGNIDNGPVVFNVAGIPNEMWFTTGGNLVATSWGTQNIYLYALPWKHVGINRIPQMELDVIGTIRGSALSSSYISTGDINATGNLTVNNVTFAGVLRNTGSNVSISQTGIRVSQYTGSTPIINSGMWIGRITASAITASARNEGFFGTASWAINAISASRSLSSSIASKIIDFATINDPVLVWNNDANSFYKLYETFGAPIELYYSWNNGGNASLLFRGSTSSIDLGPVPFNIGGVTTFQDDATGSNALFNNVKSSVFVGDLTGTASWANNVVSASYADKALSASWAPGNGSGTTLVTASTYPITSSWSNNTFVADGIRQLGTSTVYSASLLTSAHVVCMTGKYFSDSCITDNGIGNVGVSGSTTNNRLEVYGNVNATALTGSISSSNLIGPARAAISASWASSSLSASISANGVINGNIALDSVSALSNGGITLTVGGPTDIFHVIQGGIWSDGPITASAVTASLYGTASNAVSSSRAVTASFALNGGGSGTTLVTASTYPITASWAINVVNGSSGLATTQSSYDISMKDMQFPFTAAFPGIAVATLNGAAIDGNYDGANNRIYHGSAQGLVYWYLTFRNENMAGGGSVTASLAFHQMRTPVNYSNGFTHSFQYFAMGTVDSFYTAIEGEIPGANDKVYWNVELFALTSSTVTSANFFSTPVLVGTNVVTQSFSGATHESGSMGTTISTFPDPNGYISPNSMLFINVKRISSDSSSIVGDRTDYTGSVAMVSSRVNWNVL